MGTPANHERNCRAPRLRLGGIRAEGAGERSTLCYPGIAGIVRLPHMS